MSSEEGACRACNGTGIIGAESNPGRHYCPVCEKGKGLLASAGEPVSVSGNDTQLDALEAAAKAATPGPWEALYETCDCNDGYPCEHGRYAYAIYMPEPWDTEGECHPKHHEYCWHRSEMAEIGNENAAFIAAANPSAVLALIDRLRTAEAGWQHWKVRAVNAEVERDRIKQRLDLAEAENVQLRAELDAAQLRSIEARNPGIDMDEVRGARAKYPR